MYLYIVLIFLIGWILHPIITKKYSHKTANLVFLLIMFPVCLFAMGFRDTSVGVDTHSYKLFFDDYAHYSWYKIIIEKPTGDGDTVELGLKIMMKLCSEIYPNYYFYQFVFSLLYLGLFTNFIYRYTTNVILAFAIFLGGGLYMQTFNIARQMLAIAIIAYAMMNILDKRFIKSIILIGVAYFFHSSSLIALIMFIIYPFRNNGYILTIVPIIMVFAIFSIEQIFLPLLMNTFGDKYLNYAISDYSRPNKGIILKIIWLINLIMAIISLFYYRKKQSIKFLAILTMGAVACYWIGLSINYADRVGLTFLPAILLMYDYIGTYINRKTIKLFYLNGFTLFYLFYFWYWTFVNENVNYSCIIN